MLIDYANCALCFYAIFPLDYLENCYIISSLVSILIIFLLNRFLRRAFSGKESLVYSTILIKTQVSKPLVFTFVQNANDSRRKVAESHFKKRIMRWEVKYEHTCEHIYLVYQQTADKLKVKIKIRINISKIKQ